MHIKTIIIEDEPLALKKLLAFTHKINYLHIAQTFDNGIDAIGYLKSNTVDLVFLDIQMEEFTGIQFLETIKQRSHIIVTTAYDKYTLKGSYLYNIKKKYNF
jgi:two-component SAPR family response regulator